MHFTSLQAASNEFTLLLSSSETAVRRRACVLRVDNSLAIATTIILRSRFDYAFICGSWRSCNRSRWEFWWAMSERERTKEPKLNWRAELNLAKKMQKRGVLCCNSGLAWLSLDLKHASNLIRDRDREKEKRVREPKSHKFIFGHAPRSSRGGSSL